MTLPAFAAFHAAADALGVFTPGNRVELVMPARRGGVVEMGVHGRVIFVDGDWVYWGADDGSRHATKKTSLRKEGR